MDSDNASLLIAVSLSWEALQTIPLRWGQLGRIPRWGKFMDILETRLSLDIYFLLLFTNDQERSLHGHMTVVGLSVSSPWVRLCCRHRTLPAVLERLGLEVIWRRRAYFSSDRRLQCQAVNIHLCDQWLEFRSVYASRFFIHRLQLRWKARALHRARGPKSDKVFWGYVSGAKKKSLGIDVLEENGVSSSDSPSKALII